MCAIQGITSASAEMDISSEKNEGRQRLRWGMNTGTVESSNVLSMYVVAVSRWAEVDTWPLINSGCYND